MNTTTNIEFTDSEAAFLIAAIDFTRKGEWFWQISPNPEAFGPQIVSEWHSALTEGHRCIKADIDTLWVLFRLVADFTPKGERNGSAEAISFWNENWDDADSIAVKLTPFVEERRACNRPKKAAKKAAKAAHKAVKQPKAAAPKARKSRKADAPSKTDLIATLIRQNQQIIELLQAA